MRMVEAKFGNKTAHTPNPGWAWKGLKTHKAANRRYQMQKHRINIFPEAAPEDFDRLVSDIRSNGYDETMPITVYEGSILDGWNRWTACQQQIGRAHV